MAERRWQPAHPIASPTGARMLNVETRRAKELELRLAGLSILEIARAVGVSAQTVHADLARALQALRDRQVDAVEQLRELDLLRVDKVLSGLSKTAFSGDPDSAREFLRALDHRAKLLGLYAPVKAQVHGKVEVQGLAELIAHGFVDEADVPSPMVPGPSDVIDALPAPSDLSASSSLAMAATASPGAPATGAVPTLDEVFGTGVPAGSGDDDDADADAGLSAAS